MCEMCFKQTNQDEMGNYFIVRFRVKGKIPQKNLTFMWQTTARLNDSIQIKVD